MKGRDATLLVIASAGHSGSTLLDLLVANHPQICSGGELNRLTLHSADRRCACGATVIECPYWNDVRSAITRGLNRGSLIAWDDLHTDLPPQTPLARVGHAADLVDDGPLTDSVRAELAAGGLHVSERSRVSRAGVRDFKWRLTDPDTNRTYILRQTKNALEIYNNDFPWKNPIRLVPEPIELALALGSSTAVRALRLCSRRSAQFIETAENSWTIVDAMAEVSNARFVVDSSKSPVRAKLLYQIRPERLRVLQLVRDGRAVAASAMRRRSMSASMAGRVWRRDNQNLAIMLRTVPDRLKLRVHYEALCEDPARELRRVCDFLGLEFEPGMLSLWSRPVHNIPGNPMLFNREARTIRKDERWRRDLTEADIQAFQRAAGRLNRSFGYI